MLVRQCRLKISVFSWRGNEMINLLGLIEMYNTYPHKDIYHDVAACLLKNFCLLDTMTSAQIT
jgi:hypothetical protein